MSKGLKRLLIAIFLIPAPVRADWAADLKVQVDKEVAQNFKNQSQVGLVLAILRENDTQIWAYGERVAKSGELVRGSSFFEIGSITKTFVGTLLALEVNRGRIKLTDTVETLWPALKGTDAGRITLEQLATHTSGLQRDPSNLVFDVENPLKGYTEAKLLEMLKQHKENGSLPRPFSYSNLGLGVLGHLLSVKLNAMTFEAYLSKNLTGPLGLSDIRLRVNGADQKRQASGHDEFLRPLAPIELGVLDPAGTLKATAIAMITYAKFNLRDPTDELSKAAAFAREPRVPVSKESRIGLTWFNYEVAGRKLVGHDGATFGHRAVMLLEPATKSAFVLLVNTANSPSCIWTAVVGFPCQVREWAKVDPALQQTLAGTYHSALLSTSATIQMINGFFGGQLPGQRPFRMWAVSNYEYAIPPVQATVVFEKDVTGVGDRFVLSQNGGTYEFKKSSEAAFEALFKSGNRASVSPLRDEPSQLFE
ncbi:MAG TPA: serine hydrolase domain-containing protein [Bdellovibrionales bacterium]|nr:serine hydrolase domain-containing protein [Bdellovibrionales bacterium]